MLHTVKLCIILLFQILKLVESYILVAYKFPHPFLPSYLDFFKGFRPVNFSVIYMCSGFKKLYCTFLQVYIMLKFKIDAFR